MKINSWFMSFGILFMLGGLLLASLTITNIPIYDILTDMYKGVGGKGISNTSGNIIVVSILFGFATSIIGTFLLALSIKKAL